jgi:hypothetical protein
MALLAIGNGAVREVAVKPWAGDRAAHQISTFTLLALISGYVWLLQRRSPLMSTREALAMGLAWALMTLTFEFGFGHYVAGTSWSALLADYDLTSGNLWVLVPIWVALAPAALRQLASRR